MKPDVNAILKLYLGAGATGGYQPVGKEERLKSAYPNDHGAMLKQIEGYLQLDYHPPSEWTHSDLAAEQRVVEKVLAERFPDLDKVSVNALACYWSYGWR
jgi:hypothetical protein